MCDVVFKSVNLLFFLLFIFAFSCFPCVWGELLFNPNFCDVVRIVPCVFELGNPLSKGV